MVALLRQAGRGTAGLRPDQAIERAVWSGHGTGKERRRWRSRMPISRTGLSTGGFAHPRQAMRITLQMPRPTCRPRSQVRFAVRTVRHSHRTATGRDAGHMPIRAPPHTGILMIEMAFQRRAGPASSDRQQSQTPMGDLPEGSAAHHANTDQPAMRSCMPRITGPAFPQTGPRARRRCPDR